MKTVIILIAITSLTLIILYTFITHHLLIKLKNITKNEWQILERELKTKFDLIPSILEIIKTYAKNENDILKGIIESRNKYTVASTPTQQMEASSQLTEAYKLIMKRSESSNELKSDLNFLKLSESLKDTENKIYSARNNYNDAVLNLNKKIKKFPSNIIANIFKFSPEVFFKDI